jgi:hypothetical protein
MSELQVKQTFAAVLPPLSKEEMNSLRESIKEDGRVKDAIDVWDGKWIADGHHRHKIAEKLNVPFKVHELSKAKFPDEASVVKWIMEKQLARRNLSTSQYSYYRGKLVNDAPNVQGKPDEEGTGKTATAKKLATDAGLSVGKVMGDAESAKAAEKLTKSLKDGWLSGEITLTKQEMLQLAGKAPAEQNKIERDVKLGHVKPLGKRSAWSVALMLGGGSSAPKAKGKKPKGSSKPKTAFDPATVVGAFKTLVNLIDSMHVAYPNQKARDGVQGLLSDAYDKFTAWAAKT